MEQETTRGSGQEGGGGKGWVWILLLVLAAAVGIGVYLWKAKQAGGPAPKEAPPAASAPGKPAAQPKAEARTKGKVVELSPKAAQSKEQQERKKAFGLNKSVDVVVTGEETLKVGGKKIPVKELKRKLVVGQRGEIVEEPLGKKPAKPSAWGIHLVRPGENLWNIHYALLREYFASRGIHLPPNADEPNPQGYSSGVGKILKFAENVVGVYNLKTGKMSRNLNLLEPGKKIVVFNLTEIFSQLEGIDLKDLDGVEFDGRVLIFPGRHKTITPPPVPGSVVGSEKGK